MALPPLGSSVPRRAPDAGGWGHGLNKVSRCRVQTSNGNLSLPPSLRGRRSDLLRRRAHRVDVFRRRGSGPHWITLSGRRSLTATSPCPRLYAVVAVISLDDVPVGLMSLDDAEADRNG